MILFDLDDAYPARLNNALDWLVDFKDRYPEFKVTLFTILGRWDNHGLLKAIKGFDFIELAAHGYHHANNSECQIWDEDGWHDKLSLYERTGLFVPIFKAPNWQMSKIGYQVLKDRSWAVAVRENQIKDVPEGAKYYCFESEPNRYHGHTWLMQKHLDEGMFINWNRDSTFDFISSHLETR